MRKIVLALVAGLLLCAQTPIRGFPPGTFQSRAAIDAAGGGGGGRTCTDDTASTNFLTRTGGSFPNYGAGSTRYADAICTFIKALESASLITGNLGGTISCGATFDGIWLMKAHTSANSLLNICGTTYNLVNHGTTFTVDAGYTGAAASYIDTQMTPNALTFYATANASIFAGTSTNFVSGTDYGAMLSSGGIFLIRIYPHYSNDNYYYGANGAGFNLTAPTPGHFYGATRASSAGATAWIDTTGTTDANSTNAIPSVLYLLADDTSGTDPFTGVETFASVGSNLTSTQEGQLQAAYAAYVASVP